jgi:hypothetical protein
MRTLLIVKSAVEIGAGLLFACFPAWTFSVLFGEPLDSPLGIRASRIIGVALCTLGLACWLARNDSGSHAATGLMAALLLYDVAFAFILVAARLGSGLSGIGLWPVAVLHSGLAIWSSICLKKGTAVVRAA